MSFNWDDFFEKWKTKYNISVFMKDGIVCKERYENILFILKDVNNAKPDDKNDICDYVKNSTDGGKTWFNVARWVQALLDGISYEKHTMDVANNFDNNMHLFQHAQMKRAAILNLKKEAGGPSVDDSVINAYAKEHKQEIFQQIALCEPRIIVVCGLGILDGVKEVLGDISPIKKERPILEMASNWEIGTVKINLKDIPLIQFRHPSTGCNAQKSYNDMIKIREYIL